MTNNINERIGMWPASGVHTGVVDVMHAIGNSVLAKFPKNFFKSFQYDTKNGYYSQYTQTKRTPLKGQDGKVVQQLKPRFTCIYNHRNNDTKETGLGDVDPFLYPMSQGFHPDMHHYFRIYEDDKGMTVYTSNKRVRVEVEIIAECETQYDQEVILSYFENTQKMQYGTELHGIRASFIMPNDMIRFMRAALYYNNLQTASSEHDKDLRVKLFDEIQNAFNAHLIKYSNKGIYPYKDPKNPNKYFYLMDRIYNSIYWQITSPPEKGDGDRKGEIYEKFTVTMSGFFEFSKPINYMVKLPDIMGGILIDDIMKISIEPSDLLEQKPTGFLPRVPKRSQIPDYVRPYIENGEFELLYKETEFVADAPKDSVDLLEWMEPHINSDHLKEVYSMMKEMSSEDFNKLIRTFVYENNVLIDPIYDAIVDDKIIYLSNTDDGKIYSLYVLYNKREIDLMIKTKEIKKEIE